VASPDPAGAQAGGRAGASAGRVIGRGELRHHVQAPRGAR
jgi:hypothetical protein